MSQPPVVVVGAGPVGLTLGCELLQRGVPVRVIERVDRPHPHAKAIIVWPRGLEALGRIGAAERVLAQGHVIRAQNYHSGPRLLARTQFGRLTGTRYPYALSIPQELTEGVLRQRFQELGGSIEFGVRLDGFQQDGDRVRLTLGTEQGVREESCSWLVGCDGAHSTVRDRLGVPFTGSSYPQQFLLADGACETELAQDEAHYFMTPSGVLVVVGLPGGLYRVFVSVDPDLPVTDPVATVQRAASERCPVPLRLVGEQRTGVFRVHRKAAERWRVGRVLLAGDAAHIHSPAGGQGMNTGMQDAFNLGWKLAAAYRGSASQTLIDSYHAERHPVAARVIEFSTRLTRLSTLTNPVAQQLRNAVLHTATGIGPARSALADETEETTLTYHGSPAVVGSAAHAKIRGGDHLPDVSGTDLRRVLSTETGHVLVTLGPGRAAAELPGVRQVLLADTDAAVDGFDVVVADPDRRAAARFGLASGRIMVRPDGYVGAIADGDDDRPITAYRELTARPE